MQVSRHNAWIRLIVAHLQCAGVRVAHHKDLPALVSAAVAKARGIHGIMHAISGAAQGAARRCTLVRLPTGPTELFIVAEGTWALIRKNRSSSVPPFVDPLIHFRN